MEMNFNKDTWKKFLEKFSSYKGSVTDYCKENVIQESSTIKIELGRANIYIPSENTSLFSTVIKEILKLC